MSITSVRQAVAAALPVFLIVSTVLPFGPGRAAARPPAEPSSLPVAAVDRSGAGFTAGRPWLLDLRPSMAAWGAVEDGSAVYGNPDEAPEPGPIRRRPGSPDWPKDFEVGLQAARAFAYYFGLVEDDSLLARVNRIGYEVASQAGHPGILFTFHILDVPDPNALALPGGFLFVTRGMMDLHLTDQALAHLIGHEIAHVTEGHFGRSDRLNAALSLLQTAILVAAIIAVPAGTSGGVDRDPDTGDIRYSATGKEAAIQGTSIFGSVFRELLLRGYSRGLEMEADDVGRRYAGRAGYAVGGGVELMEELHRRIYEDQEFGYWRTHPYFNDRVSKARAALESRGTPADSSEVTAYRKSVQNRLSNLAASVVDDPTALFLYRAALQAGPGGKSSIEVERRLLEMRVTRLSAQKPILRSYGPVIAAYDSLIVQARRASSPQPVITQLETERDAIERERRQIYEESLAILDRPQTGIRFLQLFVENFPDDPRTPQVRLRLAEQYRLSDRPDAAALVLNELNEDLRQPEAAGKIVSPEAVDAEARLRNLLPLTRELTTNQTILLESSSDSVRAWASVRLRTQAAELDSLEVGSRFLQEYPISIVTGEVREKVEELAMKRYYAARLKESLGDYQAALDGYHELLLLAQGTQAARLARQGVDRIQSLAGK